MHRRFVDLALLRTTDWRIMASAGAVFAVLLGMPSMSSAATRHLHEFSSPDGTVWCFEFAGAFGCNATPPPSVSRASEYVVYMDSRGEVQTCSAAQVSSGCSHFYKYQNVAVTGPVLAYGEPNEILGFRCTSGSTGVTCTKVAGTGAGNGFRINAHEAVRVGSTSTSSTPTPTFGRTATVRTVSGTVLVKTPGSASFIPLSTLTSVPMATTIDTTNGTVQLTSAADRRGHTQTGQFYGGAFQLAQRRVHSQQRRGASVELTVLRLTDATAAMECPAVTARATAARRRHRAQLWGRTHGGSFAAETHDVVAGRNDPTWLTEETCSGTLVKVTQGVVSVENLHTHRAVLVRAGHSLLTPSRVGGIPASHAAS
jgi:hypothetical protein